MPAIKHTYGKTYTKEYIDTVNDKKKKGRVAVTRHDPWNEYWLWIYWLRWNDPHNPWLLETKNGATDCTLEMPLLEQYFPAIAMISYESFVHNISDAVTQMHNFAIHATFTLACTNAISHIQFLHNWIEDFF